MDSLKKTARLAGLLYIIMAVPAAYGLMYVPSQIIVRGDAIATANNILANELLFRSGIAGLLFSQVFFLLLAFVLYRLFKQVNEHQAKIMVALVIVQVPIGFLIEVIKMTALMILKGNVLKSFEPGQMHDLVTMFLKIGNYGTLMLEIYWGLWLIPLAQLVYKSGFIPRVIGVLLIINGIGYIANSFTFLFFPNFNTKFLIITFFGELIFMLWLLIKGVSDSGTQLGD